LKALMRTGSPAMKSRGQKLMERLERIIPQARRG
jgi:hypothetical protein